MARIYISSTFEDLIEARQKVCNILRKMKHEVISMEDYAAFEERPLEKCLADVRKCDIYVGIFAWRYGYIPPGQKKSITELEFLEAKRNEKSCYLFMLKESVPWPRNMIDRDPKKIEHLRAELCSCSGVGFFEDVNELAALVSVAISQATDAGRYLISRGVEPFIRYRYRPEEPWDMTFQGIEDINSLRFKLLTRKEPLENPILITISGTLFPCGLLASGWWERCPDKKIPKMDWKNDIQEWLFYGFDLWAPSWDFSWELDNSQPDSQRPYFITQLGSGDEADSLPVIIPQNKASHLRWKFQETWGGLEVEIRGLLGHRDQFKTHFKEIVLFGGLLDYCLWLSDEDKNHEIIVKARRTDIYSGYLWKCLVPRKWIKEPERVGLDQVFFVWEHTNFVKKDAIKYNLDGLLHKEKYIKRSFGELALIQKSSWLVPGRPEWTPQQVYEIFECSRFGDKI
jgi:hypothetical protein